MLDVHNIVDNYDLAFVFQCKNNVLLDVIYIN